MDRAQYVRTMIVRVLVLIFLFGAPPHLFANSDEMSLFSGNGEAVAYIALNDALTIYLWSGKPVAYLDEDSSGVYHVYGFNGKHLGWFAGGIIRDHSGDASCATKAVISFAGFESFKNFKQFKPFKSFKEFAPYKPYFSQSFGQTPCDFLLAYGGQN